MPKATDGVRPSTCIACPAAGQGTIRLAELATPSCTASSTAAFTDSCMPRSSQLMIRTRVSVEKPNSSLDRHSAGAAAPARASTAST
jgi:hypothetical protein